MVLTKEENELITQVGPGTPGGDLLRRYWHPVATVKDLTDERPKKRVKILGEDLVLYRSAGVSGQGPGARGQSSSTQNPSPSTPGVTYGLVAEHCQHRGVSLYYGFLEDGCIRCPYHGWLYDKEGRCVEQPFEPAQSMMRHTISHPAYPVEELGGLLFTYMGPRDKQPHLPRWDVLTWGGKPEILIRGVLKASWIQPTENTADVTHLHFLHYGISKTKGLPVPPEGRLWMAYGFQPFEWGLLKSWRYEGDYPESGWGRLLVFPNMLRFFSALHWRVPMDDTHTLLYSMEVNTPRGESEANIRAEPEVSYEESWLNEEGDFHLNTFSSQDSMAWETQGAVYDRTKEHLGASDVGVAMFRQMLIEQIRTVQQGGDPMALCWEPHDVVDLRQWLTDLGRGGSTPADILKPREEVFDDRYTLFELPVGVSL